MMSSLLPFLYACTESLCYLSDTCIPNFFVQCSVVYYYLFVGFNILFAKRYIFVRCSLYVPALSKKCLKNKILQI